MRSFRTGAMAAMMASPSAWADDPESMSEGSDTSTDRASSSAHTSSSLAARRAARAEARTEAREVRALRCRAAREKLRVVHRAISDHDEYLAELDAYERASLAYRAKVAAVEAAEATKRAAREALRLVGLDPSEDLSDQKPDPPPAPSGSAFDPSRDPPPKPADPIADLGPPPTPPDRRDPMNDALIAADGAKGPPLFLLACAALEGAGDDALTLAKTLLGRGADPNGTGSRPNHGKKLAVLCLLASGLEGKSDPPEGEAARVRREEEREALEEAERRAREETTGDDVFDDQQQAGGVEDEVEKRRETVREGSAQDRDRDQDPNRNQLEETDAAVREDAYPALYPELYRGTRVDATLADLCRFASAVLAAPGCEVNATARVGPVRDPRVEAIAEPYRRVVPYGGKVGTEGSPLFLAALAAVRAPTADAAEQCLGLCSRLLAAGADPNASGTRPGTERFCGSNIAPVHLALVALEMAACDEVWFARDDAEADAAALVASDSDGDAEWERVRRDPRARAAIRDAERARTLDVAARLAAMTLDAMEREIEEERRREEARRREAEAAASKESKESRESKRESKPPPPKPSPLDAVARFTHKVSPDELRSRRLAPGKTGTGGAAADHRSSTTDAFASTPFAGAPLFLAAVAAAEGAGWRAVAIAERLLAMGASADACGSRPAHCEPGTPALAMCIAALEGRRNAQKPKEDPTWWPRDKTGGASGNASVAGSRVPSVLSAPDSARRFKQCAGVLEQAAHAAAMETGAFASADGDAESNQKTAHAEKDAVATGWASAAVHAANEASRAIAEAHRATRLAAESALRSASTFLSANATRDDPDREARARADAYKLIVALVDAGADVNAPMRVRRPRVTDLCTDVAYPLGIALGLFVDGVEPEPIEAARVLLYSSRCDVRRGKCFGVGPFPIVAPPLYQATLAIHRDRPGSVDLFHRLLDAGADVDEAARFPEGSECTPLIELLHVLREGRIHRPGVLGLVEELLDAGADVRKAHPEVYVDRPHAAYAVRETDPRAVPGEHVDALEALVASETQSLVASAAERRAASESSDAAGFGDGPRLRLTEQQLDQLAEKLAKTHGYELTRTQIERLVNRTRRRHPYKTRSDDGAAAEEEEEDSFEPAESAREESLAATVRGAAAAMFPASRPRVGKCEYTPLFWALEAVCGNGHDEARRAVELVAAKLDFDVDATQGLNHHSWSEGSMVAMAVAAAIEAAAPPAPTDKSVSPSEVMRGAIEWNELDDQVAEAERRERRRDVERVAGKADKDADKDDEVGETKRERPRERETGATGRKETRTVASRSRNLNGRVLNNVERAFANPEYRHPPETARRASGWIANEPVAKNAAKRDEGDSEGDSLEGRSEHAAARDMRTAAALAAARAANAALPPVAKLPPSSERSRWRGAARNALGSSRFDKKTRAESRANANASRIVGLWRGVGERTPAGLVAERSPEETLDPATKKERDVPVVVSRATASFPATEDAGETPGGERKKPWERGSRRPLSKPSTVLRPGVAGPPEERLTAREAALHAEIDAIGPASEIGEKTPPAPSRPRRRDAGTDDGILGDLLAALVGGASAEEMETRAAELARVRDAEARRLEDARRVSRALAVRRTASFLLSKTKRVDAAARNPLLAQLGAASMAPCEYAPLFVALHGAACAKSAEQMRVASAFATACLDLGASVNLPGAHARVGGFPAPDFAEPMLRSFPLMWATAAALRSDNPDRGVDAALATVRRMIVAGADPTAMNLRVAPPPAGASEKENPRSDGLVRGRVLHLWDERALLLEVFDQGEWQRVISLRMKLASLLTEAGARSIFRPATAMDLVARRAALAEADGDAGDARERKEEKVRWAEGVRRTRELLEHGGVPSQYAVWVWPDEAAGDRIASPLAEEEDPAEKRAATRRHRAPDPARGRPAAPGEIEVVAHEDVARRGAAGVVDVAFVARDAVDFDDVSSAIEFGYGYDEEKEVFLTTTPREKQKPDEHLSGGDLLLPSKMKSLRSEAARRAEVDLAARLLWEDNSRSLDADGVLERQDAARRASLLAVRELLGRNPLPTPPGSDSEGEGEPEPSEPSTDQSEYVSAYRFVPQAPKSRKKRGFVHHALVYLGFRRKKTTAAAAGEEGARRGDETRRAWAWSPSKAEKKIKPPLGPPKPPESVLFTRKVEARRREEVETIAAALMRAPDAGRDGGYEKERSLAETARRRSETRRGSVPEKARRATEEAPRPERRAASRPKRATQFSDEWFDLSTARDERAVPPETKTFGALGAYMEKVEREIDSDWTRTTRPVRRRGEFFG